MNGLINKKQAQIQNYFKNILIFKGLVFKYLYQTNDKEKNNELVNVINSGLKDLKEEIHKMSEREIKIEKLDKIVKIVEKILRFNKQKK